MSGIDNLEQLIQARDQQMGGNMLNREESAKEPKNQNGEILEIMKLLFTYFKETAAALNSEIITIRQQQEKILEILEKKDEE